MSISVRESYDNN